jgi:hypothetical protein
MAEKFDPSKPLPSKDAEDEVQDEAKARARLKWLMENDYKGEPEPAPRRKRGVFSNRD